MQHRAVAILHLDPLAQIDPAAQRLVSNQGAGLDQGAPGHFLGRDLEPVLIDQRIDAIYKMEIDFGHTRRSTGGSTSVSQSPEP